MKKILYLLLLFSIPTLVFSYDWELIDDDYPNTYYMASVGDRIYIITGDSLFEVDEFGEFTFIDDGWYSVNGMASVNEKLYIVSGNLLFEVTVGKNYDYEVIDDDWPNVTSMTSMGGILFIVSSEQLYKVWFD